MENRPFIIRFRKVIILLTGLVLLVSIALLTRITFNPDLRSYLPDSIPAKIDTDSIEAVFGSGDYILLVVSAEDVLQTVVLERISRLTSGFRERSEFSNVISLTTYQEIRGDSGRLVVTPLIPELPVSQAEAAALRHKVETDELVWKHMVSVDYRHALIMLKPRQGVSDRELMEAIAATLSKAPGMESITMTGLPVLRYEAERNISHDLMLLLPAGLFLMFLFLWFSFRDIRNVLLPFSVVLFSTVAALAMIPLFGWQLSIIGILLPIMMIAIANNYGIYFIARQQELLGKRAKMSMEEMAADHFNYLKKPVIFCGLTTIAGVMGMISHVIRPASQMGIVSAIAVAFALTLSLLYIPAVMSMMKMARKVRKACEGLIDDRPSAPNIGVVNNFLGRAGRFSVVQPLRVAGLFMLILLALSSGVFKIRNAADHNRILPQKHFFNQSLKIINTEFGGNKMISLMFEGDVLEPVFLKKLDVYTEKIRKTEGVGSVASLTTLIRKISKGLFEPGDEGYDRIPDTKEAAAQYLELYLLDGDPVWLEEMADFGFTRALLTIQYQAGSLSETEELERQVTALVQEDPQLSCVGGYSLIEKEICRSVVTGQYSSLLFALAAIFILLSIIFKSFTAGWMGSLPLVFAVLCTFGFMGWTGMELNIVTALLSSVSIGLGVDFTIQMLWKIKSGIGSGLTMEAAVPVALTTIGKGIFLNALAVMLGFAVLFLSAFPVIRSFAVLIIISLFLCLSSALILIPALCVRLRPRFLYKSSNKKND